MISHSFIHISHTWLGSSDPEYKPLMDTAVLDLVISEITYFVSHAAVSSFIA
jgi:hypothetical protein